jgi:DHA2 family multidrug resistance protein-like MFS transporter
MTRRQIAALAALSSAVFLVAIDSTVLSIAVPQITEQLNATYTQVLWIGDIYSFMLAGLLVTMGNIGDRIGRKRLLIIAAIGFGIMSVAAALAPDPNLLIAARALQGMAGAGLMPPTLALIRAVFTDSRQRTKAIGIWSAAGSAGASVGPSLAGFLLEHFYWGSVLLINVPVVIFIIAVGAWALPESRGDAKQPIDVASIVLSTFGILLAVYGITELAHRGLAQWQAYVGLAIAIPLLLVFARRQFRLQVPLLDFGLFRIPAFSAAVMAQFSVVFAATGALFFLPIFFQEVSGYSPLRTGLSLLPVSLVSMIVAPQTGRLLRRFGARRVLLTGMTSSSVGLVAVGLLASAPYWTMVIPLAMLGFGFATVLTTAADLVLKVAPPARVGAATGVSETSFELGAAMGIALMGSLLTMSYQWLLNLPAGTPAEAAAATAESISQASEATAALPAEQVTDILTAAGEAFTSAITMTAIVAGLLLSLAAIAAARTIPARGTPTSPQDESDPPHQPPPTGSGSLQPQDAQGAGTDQASDDDPSDQVRNR